MASDICVGGYAYSVDATEEPGGHRGRILVKAHRPSGRAFEPLIEIETPTLFKRERAAEIEARAFARDLIDGGHLEARIQARRGAVVEASMPQSQPLGDALNHAE